MNERYQNTPSAAAVTASSTFADWLQTPGGQQVAATAQQEGRVSVSTLSNALPSDHRSPSQPECRQCIAQVLDVLQKSPDIDKASIDKASIDKASIDKASIDKASIDKASIDKASEQSRPHPRRPGHR